MPSNRLHKIGALLAIATVASTQQIIPSSASATFPSCALSCALLTQAQQTCQSSYPAGTPQLTYDNCFCQSGSLQALYTTPDSICTNECPVESDRTTLRAWFTSFCNEAAQGVAPVASSSQPAATAATTVVTITSTSSFTPAPTITGSGSGQNVAPAGQQSWIASHWRWILMLGILIIGLGLLSWLAVWLKRRHRRKLEEQRASVSGFPTPSEKRREGARSATPELWGPHQHMHATKGWQYHTESAGVIPDDRSGSRRHERKRSKRERTPRSREPQVAGATARPSASRHHSSKDKGKERVEGSNLLSESSKRRGSRSRSHRRRDRDRDKAQDIDVEKGLRRPSSSPEK